MQLCHLLQSRHFESSIHNYLYNHLMPFWRHTLENAYQSWEKLKYYSRPRPTETPNLVVITGNGPCLLGWNRMAEFQQDWTHVATFLKLSWGQLWTSRPSYWSSQERFRISAMLGGLYHFPSKELLKGNSRGLKLLESWRGWLTVIGLLLL